MNPLKEKLALIEGRILGWPDNVPSWAYDMDPDSAFHVLETELQSVLNDVFTLPSEQKEEMRICIQSFQEKMRIHHLETERRLKEIQGEGETSFHYINASRAYSQGFK